MEKLYYKSEVLYFFLFKPIGFTCVHTITGIALRKRKHLLAFLLCKKMDNNKYRVTKECIICKQNFEIRTCDLGKRLTGKYCSKHCAYKGKSIDAVAKRPLNNCPICQKKFYVKKSQRQKYKTNHCSIECMSIAYKTLLLADNNPNYKGGICSDKKQYASDKGKEWRAKNKFATRIYNHNRKAKIRNATGKLTKTDIQKKLISQKNKCWWCMKKLESYHIDHVIPLAKGGEHSPRNIVISCPTCNMRKGAKLPQEFAGKFF